MQNMQYNMQNNIIWHRNMQNTTKYANEYAEYFKEYAKYAI
jgi:hypothetical protein